MKLFLIRHTEAIDYETESVRNDELRFITPKGRKVSQTVFRALKEDLLDLDKIYTSPIIRSVQTAEVLAVMLKYRHDVEVTNDLLVSSTPAQVVQLLKRNTVFASIALVGHEPMLGQVVETITGRQPLNFQFKKSGVCYIDFNPDKGDGKFVWYYDPKTSQYVK